MQFIVKIYYVLYHDICTIYYVLIGVWTSAHDPSGTVAYVRNLYWEGYGFYCCVNTSDYGGVYFGNGVPQYDIAFMM